ncbi:MAG: MFS transporter [Firmicutes bacterium]|nr:MFS transporter [Bacillota bacterium]MCL5039344.1 MFS transporter [Bacillota bacterium]
MSKGIGARGDLVVVSAREGEKGGQGEQAWGKGEQDLGQSELGRPEKPNLGLLLLLSFAHAITDINQGSVPALLPFIKEMYQLSYAAAGSILLVANLTSSIIQPLFGYLSDRSTTLWILPFGVFLSAGGVTALGLVPSLPLIYLAVALTGLGVASYHPGAARVAYFASGARRATGTALFSVGGNIGFALGPLLTTMAVDRLGRHGIALSMLPGLLTTFLVILWMRGVTPGVLGVGKVDTRPGQQHSPSPARKGMTGINWWGVSLVVLLVAIRSWIQFGLITFVPFYYINVLGGSHSLAGRLVFVFLASGALGTVLGGPLADRIGLRPVLYGSMGILFPLQALLLHSSGWWTVLLLSLAGLAVVATFAMTLVMSQDYMPGYPGVASGLAIGFSIGMGGIGVTLLGALADRWGVPATLEMMVFLPIIGLLVTFFLPRTRNEVQAA